MLIMRLRNKLEMIFYNFKLYYNTNRIHSPLPLLYLSSREAASSSIMTV